MSAPAGDYKQGGARPDPFKDEKPIFSITAQVPTVSTQTF